jgi:hypothetical protein
MFGTHDLWLFVLSSLLLNITPGPDTLYIVGRGVCRAGSCLPAVKDLGDLKGMLMLRPGNVERPL